MHDLILHVARESLGEPDVLGAKVGQHQVAEFVGCSPIAAQGIGRKAWINVKVYALSVRAPCMRPGHRLPGTVTTMKVHM